MQNEDRRVDPVRLYVAGVTVLAATSILLMYLLYRIAVPEVFNALFESPSAAVGNHPRSIALFFGVLVVIGLLVVAVVALGARAANQTAVEERRPPRE